MNFLLVHYVPNSIPFNIAFLTFSFRYVKQFKKGPKKQFEKQSKNGPTRIQNSQKKGPKTVQK